MYSHAQGRADGDSGSVGNEANEMGNNLISIDFGTDAHVIPIDLVSGLNFNCVLFNS